MPAGGVTSRGKASRAHATNAPGSDANPDKRMTFGRYIGDNCGLLFKLCWFQMPAVLKISHCRLFFPRLWLLPDEAAPDLSTPWGAVRGLIRSHWWPSCSLIPKTVSFLGLDKTMADQTTGDLVARQEWLEPSNEWRNALNDPSNLRIRKITAARTEVFLDRQPRSFV